VVVKDLSCHLPTANMTEALLLYWDFGNILAETEVAVGMLTPFQCPEVVMAVCYSFHCKHFALDFEDPAGKMKRNHSESGTRMADAENIKN